MTEAEREAKRQARAVAMEEGRFQAEVDRQHDIERKRLRLDPVADPEADRRLRNRVERSVRIQWREGAAPSVNPAVRTELELQESVEKAIDDALRKKGLDVENPTHEQKLEAEVEKARIRALYARQGRELPSGPSTYAPTLVSHKIQSAAPASVGAGRSRIPVARLESRTAPTRSLTEREETQWLERVERSDEEYKLDPAKPRRIRVASYRWNNDSTYKQRIWEDAQRDLEDRMSTLSAERKALVPIETHIVNEHGRTLLRMRPSMDFMQRIADRVAKEGA